MISNASAPKRRKFDFTEAEVTERFRSEEQLIFLDTKNLGIEFYSRRIISKVSNAHIMNDVNLYNVAHEFFGCFDPAEIGWSRSYSEG